MILLYSLIKNLIKEVACLLYKIIIIRKFKDDGYLIFLVLQSIQPTADYVMCIAKLVANTISRTGEDSFGYNILTLRI